MTNKKKVSKVFKEWAADFRATGNAQEAGFYEGLAKSALLDSKSVSIDPEAIKRLKMDVAMKLQFTIMPGMTEEAKIVQAWIDEMGL